MWQKRQSVLLQSWLLLKNKDLRCIALFVLCLSSRPTNQLFQASFSRFSRYLIDLVTFGFGFDQHASIAADEPVYYEVVNIKHTTSLSLNHATDELSEEFCAQEKLAKPQLLETIAPFLQMLDSTLVKKHWMYGENCNVFSSFSFFELENCDILRWVKHQICYSCWSTRFIA